MVISEKIRETSAYLEKNSFDKLRFGIILGTGFGSFIESMDNIIGIPYASIPHFPVSTVEGHDGNLVYGTIQAVPIVAMQGRFHKYEGYSNDQIGYPIHVMKNMGVDTLVITNAAGGLNPAFQVGDLMVVSDHIHFMGGWESSLYKSCHHDTCYDPGLKDILLRISIQNRIPVQQGILSWMHGPSFETPAEIKLLRYLGADAVTMSTIPEAITARNVGLKVMGISCISNQCIGTDEGLINTADVMLAVRTSAESFSRLIFHILGDLN